MPLSAQTGLPRGCSMPSTSHSAADRGNDATLALSGNPLWPHQQVRFLC